MLAGEVNALVTEQRNQPTIQGACVNVAELLTQLQTPFAFVMPLRLVPLHNQLRLLLLMVSLCPQSLQQCLIVPVIFHFETIVLQHGEEGLLDHLRIWRVETKIRKVVVGWLAA